MSEVELLYKNAGVRYLMYVVDTFPPVEYPQIKFTPEKQLSLIKWLCDTDYYITEFCRLIDTREYYIETDYKHFQSSSFEETLAGLINNLWQDLTESEQEQIKKILEE